ncbi:hypothetical protein [Variovorax sp. Sphag1AA]|uniref:hypothetical protein n=1 Tax=Variovorax sp. Sphag1AA TaxID=2587027 RepID=UPI00160A0839|nr:hypothetical protein [Variovorax sp. Sphag1AA]MBB3175702.1 hypothetical protein [Variovorax sp. Sphag1AA]
MESARHRVLPFTARVIAPLLLALCASGAFAQDAREFPGAAMRFLNVELPQMENAIKERDRDYFEDAMSRMLDFSEQWGFKVRDNPQLASYPMCTEAVSDFLVVGMCRIMTTASACEPGMQERFNTNLQKCRAVAQ